MTKPPFDLGQRPSYLTPTLASLVAHAAAAGVITMLLSQQAAGVRKQEATAIENVAEIERAEEKAAEQERATAAKELVATTVQQQLEELVRNHVNDAEVANRLLGKLEAMLDERLANLDAEQPLAERDEAQLAALEQALEQELLNQIDELAADTQHEALLEVVADYARDQAANDLAGAVTNELSTGGDPVVNAVRDAAKQALGSAANDAAVAAAAREALPALGAAARSATDAALRDQAVPAVADRLAKAVNEQLSGSPLGQDPALAAAVRAAAERGLREGLAAAGVDGASALNKAKEAFGAADAKQLSEAKAAVDAAAAALRAAAAASATVAAGVNSAAPESSAAAAAANVDTVTAATAAGRAAAQSAASASSQVANGAKDADRQLAEGRAATAARDAASTLAHGQADAGKGALGQAANDLNQAADKLAGVAAGLGREAAAAAAAGTGPAADAKASAAAGSTGTGAATAAAKTGVARGADGVGTGGLADSVREALGRGGIGQLSDLASQVTSGNADRSASAVGAMGGGTVAGLLGGSSPGAGNGTGTGSGAGEGSGSGSGSGAGGSHLSGKRNERAEFLRPGDRTANSRYNRAAADAFISDLVERANPGNAYGLDVAANAKAKAVPVARSNAASATVPAVVVAADSPTAAVSAKPTGERSVPKPRFATKAVGYAPMMARRPVIDGDVSDWGPLTFPITMQYGSDSTNVVADGQTMHLRWSTDGLFITYRVPCDPASIVGAPEKAYEGDVLELFLDMDNSRKRAFVDAQFTHQFCFTPFGCLKDESKRVCEVGWGMRGIPKHSVLWRPDAHAAASTQADGYTVECFLPRIALAKRKLIPGEWLAVNVSINHTLNFTKQRQWSASKSVGGWDDPSSWGDVLLLGADATAAIEPGRDLASDPLVPGRPIAVEVRDADANLNPTVLDRVAGSLALVGSDQPLFIVLEETGANTGVFRAASDTQSAALPFRDNTLGVQGGDVIRFTYLDACGAFGESKRPVTAEAALAYPIVTINRNL